MTDDTELYGAAGGDAPDSYDREFLLLMRQARAQGLRLWRQETEFCLDDDHDTVFKTDRTGLDGLQAISAWLTARGTEQA